MLLAVKNIEGDKWHLYAMEMVYQKVLRIIKIGPCEEIRKNWRIGFVTQVQSISRWSLEENTYVTSQDKLIGEYNNIQRLLLNKAAYPDWIIPSSSGISYGIIRIRQVEILEKGNRINSTIWGLGTKCSATVIDPWWINYWSKKYSIEAAERYQKYLSALRKKVFAFIENNASRIEVLKLIVL